MIQRLAVLNSDPLLQTELCPLDSFVGALAQIHMLRLLGGEPLGGDQVESRS